MLNFDLFEHFTGTSALVSNVLSGAVSLLDVLMVVIFYSLGWFLVASLRFAAEQWRVVRQGVTSFEFDHRIKVIVVLSLCRRLSRPRFHFRVPSGRLQRGFRLTRRTQRTQRTQPTPGMLTWPVRHEAEAEAKEKF